MSPYNAFTIKHNIPVITTAENFQQIQHTAGHLEWEYYIFIISVHLNTVRRWRAGFKYDLTDGWFVMIFAEMCFVIEHITLNYPSPYQYSVVPMRNSDLFFNSGSIWWNFFHIEDFFRTLSRVFCLIKLMW